MEAVISTENLAKNYGDLVAVNSISLTVLKGSLFGLLGPNGSGKTTMIKMLTGQIHPTSGNAKVLGVDVREDPVEVRRRVGIIPEQESPPSFLTTLEYLEFIGDIRKIVDIEKKTDWWLDFLEYGDKRNVLCKDLSRGTRQKLMLTQAFIHKPELALIDEPLINFDPIMQAKVKEFLVSYVKQGKTIFLSTHLLETAEVICSEVAILHKGNLLFIGSMDSVQEGGRHLPDVFLLPGLPGVDSRPQSTGDQAHQADLRYCLRPAHAPHPPGLQNHVPTVRANRPGPHLRHPQRRYQPNRQLRRRDCSIGHQYHHHHRRLHLSGDTGLLGYVDHIGRDRRHRRALQLRGPASPGVFKPRPRHPERIYGIGQRSAGRI